MGRPTGKKPVPPTLTYKGNYEQKSDKVWPKLLEKLGKIGSLVA